MTWAILSQAFALVFDPYVLWVVFASALFGLFVGVQDEHREHTSEANLLKPYRVAMQGTRARQRWEIPSLNLAFTVTLGGGARTDCESWYILLEPLNKSSQ